MVKKRQSNQSRFLILGHSESLPVIALEIASSALPEKAEIVLVSKMDPGESVRALFGRPVRHIAGNPADFTVLEGAEPAESSWILVNTTGSPDGDLQAVKIVHNLKAVLGTSDSSPDILVLTDSEEYRRKAELAEIRGMHSFCPNAIFPEVAAQACRQINLEEIYRELFSYHGNEIYLIPAAQHEGSSWSSLLRGFENACPIGIRREGKLELNPPQDTLIQKADKIYTIALQIEEIKVAECFVPAPEIKDLSPTEVGSNNPEHFIFLGWNNLVPAILADLAHYVPHGSKIHIIHDKNPGISDFISNNLSIEWQSADPSDPEVLAGIEFANWENIVIPGVNFPASSSQLEILQTVRELLAIPGLGNNITTLIGTPAPDSEPSMDILSTDLLYKLSVQLLLQPALMDVFRELVQPIGTEINLKPAQNYISLENPVDFYTIIEAARRKNQTAIGYMLSDSKQIVLNPQKKEKVQFNYYDKIVVLTG